MRNGRPGMNLENTFRFAAHYIGFSHLNGNSNVREGNQGGSRVRIRESVGIRWRNAAIGDRWGNSCQELANYNHGPGASRHKSAQLLDASQDPFLSCFSADANIVSDLRNAFSLEITLPDQILLRG